MSGERWDVFVSYGQEDADRGGVLAGNLRCKGSDAFLEEWERVGGDRVRDQKKVQRG